MTKNLKPGGRFVQLGGLALCAILLVFFALHHGTYSVIDRQQAAVGTWLAIGLLAAFGFLPRAELKFRDWLPALGLLAIGAWMAIGLLWTESSERTFEEVARVGGYLGLTVLMLLAAHRRSWRLIAAGVLTAMVVVCALAFASRIVPEAFPPDDVARNLNTWRLNYPLGYWNAVGCWAAITIVLCVAWSAHARSALVRGLALAAVPLCVAVMYMTFSRAALGGLGVGLIVVVAFAHFRTLAALQAAVGLLAGFLVVLVLRDQTAIVRATGTAGADVVLLTLALTSAACAVFAAGADRARLGPRSVMSAPNARRAAIAGGAIAVIAASLLVVEYGGQARDQFNTSTFAPNQAGDARLIRLNGNRVHLWRSARRAFSAEPVHGIGAGTVGYWWNRDGVNDDKVRDAHNIYLEALAEGGVPGLVLLLAFLGAIGFAAVRARAALTATSDIGVHAGLLGVFGVFLFQAGVDWIWESTAVTIAVLVAVTAAAAAARPKRASPAAARIRIAIVVVAGLALVLQLPGLAAAGRIARSEDQFDRREYVDSVASASDAIGAEPWSASAYGQRALALEAAGALKASARDLRKAQELEPTNWVWPLLDVRVQVKLGDAEQAKKSLARAKRLRRYSALFTGAAPTTRAPAKP